MWSDLPEEKFSEILGNLLPQQLSSIFGTLVRVCVCARRVRAYACMCCLLCFRKAHYARGPETIEHFFFFLRLLLCVTAQAFACKSKGKLRTCHLLPPLLFLVLQPPPLPLQLMSQRNVLGSAPTAKCKLRPDENEVKQTEDFSIRTSAGWRH